MKKYLLLTLCLIAITTSCDDGDFEVQSFDFNTSTTQICNAATNNFFIYRISNNEVLIVKFPESALANPTTPETSPRQLPLIDIVGNTEVIYRLYDNSLSTQSICSAIPPTSPNLVDEWVATSGKIRIITTVNKSVASGNSTGANQISGYTHDIDFVDINFLKLNGTEQFYDVLPFGNYATSVANPLQSFLGDLNECIDIEDPETILLFKNATNQVIELEVPANIFIPEVTPIGQPRTYALDANHLFKYKIFTSNINTANFCVNPPSLLETWTARNLNENTNPIIEVTTTIESSGFKHSIVLRNFVVEKGNINFSFGENYSFGSYFQ